MSSSCWLVEILVVTWILSSSKQSMRFDSRSMNAFYPRFPSTFGLRKFSISFSNVAFLLIDQWRERESHRWRREPCPHPESE